MADNEITITVLTDVDDAPVDDLESKLDDIKEKAEEQHQINLDDGEVDSAQSDVDNLADSLDGLSMMAVGDVLQQYGSQAEGMAQDMNQASISVGQLATNVGMAEPQMVGLINHISNATFPQNEAMAYVGALNQMGVSANNLGASATNMDRINDATGIGYQKVMQLTQGLQSVGVSADNLPSSFNAIAYAQANVNGGADTLTQVLKRQAATINEYGLNTDQLVLIMQKLSEKGVQGMKMGSELSAVLKETNGDTAALEQSLGLTAGTLSNASAVTGQYEGQLQNLADEESEHKTILDQVGAAWEDLSLSMSGIMSPIASVVGMGGQVFGFATQMNGAWELMNKFSKVEAISNGFNAIKGALTSLIPTQWAEAAAGWASIGWIVLAIALGIALGLALLYLYNNCDWFREAVDNLAASLQYVAGVIYNTVLGAIQWLSDTFTNFTNQLGLNTNDWLQAILGFILFIPQLPLQVGIALANTLAKALGFGNNFVQRITSAGYNALKGFVGYITQIPSMVLGEFQRTLQLVNDFINTLPQRVWEMGVAIINALKSALGIGSPGHMFYMVEGEFKRIDDLTQKTNFDTGSIGEQMVDSFNPSLQTSNQGVVAGGNNITINIDNVDSQERINQIVKAVEDALAFDNVTAGRSV